MKVDLNVNGCTRTVDVEPRKSLLDTIREDLGLTGTHVGCEHGVCGACTVLLDGEPVRSCLLLAVQADGYRITTIEGIAPAPGELSIVQDAFCETHAMQCGYCTPAMVLSAHALLQHNPNPPGKIFSMQSRRTSAGAPDTVKSLKQSSLLPSDAWAPTFRFEGLCHAEVQVCFPQPARP